MAYLDSPNQKKLEKLTDEQKCEIDNKTRNTILEDYIKGRDSKITVAITYEALEKAQYIAERTSQLAGRSLETAFYMMGERHEGDISPALIYYQKCLCIVYGIPLRSDQISV